MKRYVKPSITELLALSNTYISSGDELLSGNEEKDIEEVNKKDVVDIRF